MKYIHQMREYFCQNRKTIWVLSLVLIFSLIMFVIFYVVNNSFNELDSKNIVTNVSLKKSDNKETTEVKEVTETKEIEETEPKEEKVSTIKVDVKGYVVNEGVYELLSGSRVIDAITKAGGLKEGASTRCINLSKILKDENVVVVEGEEQEHIVYNCESFSTKCDLESDSVNSDTTNTEDTTDTEETKGLVNINTASLEELTSLTGIGESKAKKIIEYRSANGLFKTIEDIKNVSGIGDAVFDKIKEYITVE